MSTNAHCPRCPKCENLIKDPKIRQKIVENYKEREPTEILCECGEKSYYIGWWNVLFNCPMYENVD